ncbi:transformer-2 protein homolog beta-like [Anopheles aquasalis]|uniref:transformer-2 protein homolog beta-like n=1 Tax=Anopheles aquasalis TaxID=42839 RepID=UPI00215A94A2|nr:transformer-2 protein homolog beta-like [Anopheles aquasalis]
MKSPYRRISHRDGHRSRYESRDSRRSRSVDRYGRRHRNHYSRSRSRSYSPSFRHRSHSRSPDWGRSRRRKVSPERRTKIRVDSPEPSRCLGVFGLSVYTTEPYLIDIFCPFGAIEKAIVVYDAKTRLSRGFGFVYFKNVSEAAKARMHCNGLQMHGRRIRVDFSITDRPHSPTPGVYMGNAPNRFDESTRHRGSYSRSRSSSSSNR